jgi:hypothetical protein
MSFKKSALAVAAAATLGAGAVCAEDLNMDVTATVQAAASSAVTQDMSFGTISVDPTGDTLTLGSTSDTVTKTGISQVTGSARGIITVTGVPNIQAVIADPGAITLDHDTLAVSLTVNSVYAVSTQNCTIGPGGTCSLYVGGRMYLSPSVSEGSYSGSTTITVSYQ